MKRISTLGAALIIAASALGSQPAFAQYANEFSLAKVVKQGTTSQAIAGKGQVKIQVQVNPDGSHKVIKVISSTNPADNAAALEIANTSQYSPAHKGKTPVVSFYDYVLSFNGKSVSSVDQNSGDSVSAQVDGLIRGGKYSDAIAKANAGLASTPNNQRLTQLLGVAQYYNGDKVASAQTFDKTTGSLSKDFVPVAASAYADAAVALSQKDPAQSLAFAQKGVALNTTSPNNQFALGVAQIANGKYADGISTLKPVRDTAKDAQVKLAIDGQLLNAYLGNNDPAGANAVAADMKQLDPSGNQAGTAIASHYINLGNAATQAKNFDGALKDYDQAATAAEGTPLAVTANTAAAFAIMEQSKPDYNKAKGYALKAVAGAPDDAQANFAAGIAYQGIFVTLSHSDGDKQQALTYLKKADAQAKAAGNTGLATQIESQLKTIQ